MDNNCLYHHGIKGMKWGVRRYQNPDGSLASAGRKKIESMKKDVKNRRTPSDRSQNRKKIESMKKDVKNRRLLSDAELKKKIERIQSEKKLKDITNEELNPGKKAVTDILVGSGKKVASTVITGALLYGVKAAMTRKIDIKEAAGYMTPKPKNK